MRCDDFCMKHSLISGFYGLAFLAGVEAQAVTLDELRSDQNLTPESFVRYFADFKFVFAADVQSPELFLANEAGDCDDYSTLAASQLKARGYTTRLIAVRMKSEVHVICYVEEIQGYLDYNNRKRSNGVVHAGSDLAEIADSVAKSFKSKWTSVSEFTYSDGVKRLVSTKLDSSRPSRIAGLR